MRLEKGSGVFIPSRDESPGLTEPAAFGCSHQRADEPLETFLFFQPQALSQLGHGQCGFLAVLLYQTPERYAGQRRELRNRFFNTLLVYRCPPAN